jgi:hypothetical protein
VNAGFVSAVEMLPMPKIDSLTPAQIDGLTCVWCGRTPDGGGIVLGPRLSAVAGALRRWAPRGCRPCTGRKAAYVYQLHLTMCARCTHRDYCDDSHALRDLAQEYR